MASGIVERYLAGEARAFFPSHYRDPGDRKRALQAARRPLRPDVAAAIEAQNAAYGACPARQAQLAALRRGCAAVVTGQQVGLLLGPLYTVYKAASAVALARALSAECGEPVVPVFWLQSEDHDLAEVASCHLPRGNCEIAALGLPVPVPEERISLAHVALPEEIRACLTSLRAQLGGLLEAGAHLATLERHYRPGVGYVQAFAGVLAELFAPEGLVLVDPRQPQLAAAAAEVHARGLRDAGRIALVMQERTRALEAAGFAAPVHVRAGAPLSFFHPLGARGPRYRLQVEGDGFGLVGGTRPGERYTLAELLGWLEKEPLRFSSSALLRPIVQDSLLPTAAYVGGPGEIAYFAQLAPLYEAYQLPMPLIVPRGRFLVVEPKAERLLGRYGLVPADAQQNLDALFERCRPRTGEEPEVAEVAQRLSQSMRRELAALMGRLPQLGSELSAAAAKTQATIDKAAGRFSHKYHGALLHRNAGIVADLRRLKQLLHPLDQPQERVLGLSYFAARYGERGFIERVFSAIDPWDPGLTELRP